ncbi:hypothetical protein M0R72_11985 [Candidatus Pacearchaeota archaeon]|jgi:hypothetical protein|nr:hypothetical protein [Candidatus Pacearchaeota archaeon]
MRPFLVFLACLALYFGLLSIPALVADAATLSILGSAVGNGSQIFSVAGENITAFWNGVNWTVTGAF